MNLLLEVVEVARNKQKCLQKILQVHWVSFFSLILDRSCNLCSAAKERKEGREEEERKRERGRERRRREGRERKYIPVWPYSTHPNPHSTQVKEEGPLGVPSQQRC